MDNNNLIQLTGKTIVNFKTEKSYIVVQVDFSESAVKQIKLSSGTWYSFDNLIKNFKIL